jgi:hypothetical protein
MKKVITRKLEDDQGGRRQVKDRRFQVSVTPEEEKRTNWHRRCGFDQRLHDGENTTLEHQEKTEVP